MENFEIDGRSFKILESPSDENTHESYSNPVGPEPIPAEDDHGARRSAAGWDLVRD